MDVRTFEAFNMRDAIKSVKKELGNDAVILSTVERKMENGTGTIVEVKAAAPGFKKQNRSSRPDHLETEFQASAHSNQSIEQTIEKLSKAFATKKQIASLETNIAEIKGMLIETLQSKSGSTLKNVPTAIIPLDRTLRTMGVDAATIAELVTYLRKIPAPTGSEEDKEKSYKDHAIRYLMKRIKISSRWSVMPGTCTIQAVIGPNGSGKTTTTAKLAAHYAKNRDAKVLVISYDNNRLAASEQMRIYCKIIGVPFEAMSNALELDEILEKYNDRELVLIDTAGISPKSSEAVDELGKLKDCQQPVDFHLCLSVTEKEEQMDRSIRSFSKLGIHSLVFSKLDESWSFGEIFNLSKKWTLPLSYFSIGPDVPDDIERASRERVIERIFGL